MHMQLQERGKGLACGRSEEQSRFDAVGSGDCCKAKFANSRKCGRCYGERDERFDECGAEFRFFKWQQREQPLRFPRRMNSVEPKRSAVRRAGQFLFVSLSFKRSTASARRAKRVRYRAIALQFNQRSPFLSRQKADPNHALSRIHFQDASKWFFALSTSQSISKSEYSRTCAASFMLLSCKAQFYLRCVYV